jgi:hypothetical protein
MADPFDTDGKVITDLHWFSQHNGAKQWLVWTTDNDELRAFNGSLDDTNSDVPWNDLRDGNDRAFDGSRRERKHINTPWQGQSAQAWGGRLYMVNGYNDAIVFDGDKVERAGFLSRPEPPSVQTLSEDFDTTLQDIGLGAAGKISGHKYVQTYLNERGQESLASFPSELVIVDRTGVSTDSRYFNRIQLARGPEECVARRIYRTQDTLDSDGNPIALGAADLFYFHSEIPDNVTEEIEDHVHDLSLGPVLDTSSLGPFPNGTKYLAVFKNTMFAAGQTPNEIRYSRPLNPEVFPEDNILHIGDDDMSPVTAMYPTKNALVVFKARGVYLVKGDPVNGFYVETLTRDEGCISPRSVAELPGIGLVFMSSETINVLIGALENTGTPTRIEDIASPITDYLQRINTSAAIAARSAIFHRHKEYWLAVPTLGSSENDLVLVYHYEVGAWSTRTGFPIKCMLETRDHRGYLMFGSHDSNTLGIHVYSIGWPNKGGTVIESVWESIHHDFGNLYTTVQPVSVIVYAVAYGDHDLELNYRVNRSISNARSTPQTRESQYKAEVLGVYNDAKWGESTWGFFRPVTFRYDISTRDKARTKELQVAFSTERKVQIVGYDIEIQAGEQRNIIPMNTIFNPGRRG